MFNEYYYTASADEPIYCSIITLNNSVETSLYKGKKLLVRKSLQIGIHQLKKEDIELRVQIKWFKVIPELRINNKLIAFQKLKRKQLRSKLIDYGINNEINPKKQPKEPFNYRRLRFPSILILLGITWDVFTKGKGKFWDIPSMIIFVIAYAMIFSPLVDRIPDRHLNTETKGKLKLVTGIVGMGLTQVLIRKILQ
ncbi:MAG: hypothetical protein AAFZ15_17070 [Bacteroidota bacterium]